MLQERITLLDIIAVQREALENFSDRLPVDYRSWKKQRKSALAKADKLAEGLSDE